MPVHIIKKNQGITRKVTEDYKVINFLTKESSRNLSFAISEAKNHSETTKNIKSDRIYFVLEGKMIVGEGINKFIAEKGDLVFIPNNTKYHFEGTFRTVLVNSPAFNFKDERISEL